MKNSIFIILCILGLLVQSTIANEETNEYEEEYAENDENQATDDIEFPIGRLQILFQNVRKFRSIILILKKFSILYRFQIKF